MHNKNTYEKHEILEEDFEIELPEIEVPETIEDFIENAIAPDSLSTFSPFMVKVTPHALNVRSGPAMEYPVFSIVRKDTEHKITAINIDKNGSKWGAICDGEWVMLEYTLPI